MNFFSAQDQARRNTLLLALLFGAAVLSIMFLAYLVLELLMRSDPDLQMGTPGERFWWLSLGVGGLVLTTSLVKFSQLKGGGATVAKALGGTLVCSARGDMRRRRLLNVVEEMAIASGVPVPQVYLLPENSINAFAAGHNYGTAAIGITRGALEQLDRDELQGVIAHEFSHILNGDMRFNLRLLSLLHGIQAISYLGYFMLYGSGTRHHSSGYHRGNRIGRAPQLLAAALAFIALGSVGAFFGNWIRSAVSRQREYLADASAVQFTRNPQGIGKALQKILLATGLLRHPRASEYSHLYFSSGIRAYLGGMFATHPPLEQRIRRVLPSWKGDLQVKLREPSKELPGQKAAAAADKRRAEERKRMVVTGGIMAGVLTATGAATGKSGATSGQQLMDSIGNPNAEHVRAARILLDSLPLSLRSVVEDPCTARALCYALLVDRRDPQVRKQQLDCLQQNADQGVFPETVKLLPELQRIRLQARLPLVELALPSLRLLSAEQFRRFRDNLELLVQADRKVSLFEWCLQSFLCHHLDANFRPAAARGKAAGRPETALKDGARALFLLARAGNAGPRAAAAFTAGVEVLGMKVKMPSGQEAPDLEQLGHSMRRLNRLPPRAKERFLQACVACVQHDRRVEAPEAELLRVYAALLDCPMPPVLSKA